jgi:hypothetical protein
MIPPRNGNVMDRIAYGFGNQDRMQLETRNRKLETLLPKMMGFKRFAPHSVVEAKVGQIAVVFREFLVFLPLTLGCFSLLLRNK